MSDPQNGAERSAYVRAERAESKNLELEAQAVSLRLEVEDSARRARESEISVQALEATLAMTVARLGGEVEGAPTHRINFLQRIDELVFIEGKVAALEARVRELEAKAARGEAN